MFRRIILLSCVVLIPLLIVLSIQLRQMYLNGIPAYRGEFSVEAWETYPKWRYRMIEDMEHDIDILNLSRGEVLRFLGTTEMVETDTSFNYFVGDSVLGPQIYYVDFNREGNVQDTYLIVE